MRVFAAALMSSYPLRKLRREEEREHDYHSPHMNLCREWKRKEWGEKDLGSVSACENEFTEGIIQQCAIVKDASEISLCKEKR